MGKEEVLNRKISESDEEKAKLNKKAIFQGVSFYLDDNLYAMDVMTIKEFYTPNRLYKVPNTTDKLLGVLNLRGYILPVYSLKLILELQDDMIEVEDFSDKEKFIIIIQKDKDQFGILIDAIHKNITGTEENYRTGNYLQKWSKNYLFEGVLLDQDNEILVINIENMLKYMTTLK